MNCVLGNTMVGAMRLFHLWESAEKCFSGLGSGACKEWTQASGDADVPTATIESRAPAPEPTSLWPGVFAGGALPHLVNRHAEKCHFTLKVISFAITVPVHTFCKPNCLPSSLLVKVTVTRCLPT